MGYWGIVAKRAGTAALQDAKLTTASVVTGFVVQGLIALVLFVLTAFTDAALWTRIITAGAPFLTYPIAFLARLLTEPALIYADDQKRIEALEAAALIDLASHQLEIKANLDHERHAGRLTAVLSFHNVGDSAIRTDVTTAILSVDGVRSEPRRCDAATLRVGAMGSFYFDCGPARTEGQEGVINLDVTTTFGLASKAATRLFLRNFAIVYRMAGGRLWYESNLALEDERPCAALPMPQGATGA